MEIEKLRFYIGANIAAYRKRFGWTQAGLAERLNYTDKAVSKWERGESVPDVQTLAQLAELFGITVNELLVDPNALPENTGAVQQAMGHVVEKTLKRKANKNTILGLASILVWFVALLTFVVLFALHIPKCWLPFLYAVPVDAIVMLSLRSAWKDFRWNRVLISVLMWGGIASVCVSLYTLAGLHIWTSFLLGIPGQAAILMWFRLFLPTKTKGEQNG